MSLRAVLLLPIAVVCLAQDRFGREVLKLAEPDHYEFTKLDDLKVATMHKPGFTVKCLAYRDAARVYAEVTVKSRHHDDLRIPADFVSAQQGDAKLKRLDTVAVAHRVEDDAVKPFVASRGPGGDYDRAEVDRQAKQHQELQERESIFASLLLALAPNAQPLKIAEERTIARAFERVKDNEGPIEILVRIRDEEFRFLFKDRQ